MVEDLPDSFGVNLRRRAVLASPDPPITCYSRAFSQFGEYADLFNARPLDDVERLIADACVDPLWDDRTNLLSLLAEDPKDLGLVLALDDLEYVVVRYLGAWVVDIDPVDWDALEEQAFDPTGDDGEPPASSDGS